MQDPHPFKAAMHLSFLIFHYSTERRTRRSSILILGPATKPPNELLLSRSRASQSLPPKQGHWLKNSINSPLPDTQPEVHPPFEPPSQSLHKTRYVAPIPQPHPTPSEDSITDRPEKERTNALPSREPGTEDLPCENLQPLGRRGRLIK